MDRERDWNEFLHAIRNAAVLTGKTNLTREALDLYFDVMQDYSIEQVKQAVEAHMHGSEGRYFPTPSHLIQQIQGNSTERAYYAWRVLLKAIDKYGYYDSVRFPDPAYHYAIALLGGWMTVSEELGGLSEKELTFRRPEFVSLYQRGERVATFGREQGKERVAAYLLGAYERDNTANSYTDHIPPVVEIATGRKVKQSELAALSGGQRHIKMLEGRSV